MAAGIFNDPHRSVLDLVREHAEIEEEFYKSIWWKQTYPKGHEKSTAYDVSFCAERMVRFWKSHPEFEHDAKETLETKPDAIKQIAIKALDEAQVKLINLLDFEARIARMQADISANVAQGLGGSGD